MFRVPASCRLGRVTVLDETCAQPEGVRMGPDVAPGVARSPAPGLTIQVRSGIGTGPTTLAAFDAALRYAGVANHNLIRLSSVIPPGSTVAEPTRDGFTRQGEWGDRLYVVMAERRTDVPGDEAWAGIAWTQEQRSRKGLFVEHEGLSRERVEADLRASLTSIAGARGVTFGPQRMRVTGARCAGIPVCALVLAVYRAEPWTPAGPAGGR